MLGKVIFPLHFYKAKSLQAINSKKKTKKTKKHKYTSKRLFKLPFTSTETSLLTLSSYLLVSKLVVVLTVLDLVDLDW